jgi:hypothetical protein
LRRWEGGGEVAPVGAAGVARGMGSGFGAVVAAKGLVAGGDAAAFVAVGETEFTFGGLHRFLRTREKRTRKGRLEAAFFFFHSISSGYQLENLIEPTLLGVIGV